MDVLVDVTFGIVKVSSFKLAQTSVGYGNHIVRQNNGKGSQNGGGNQIGNQQPAKTAPLLSMATISVRAASLEVKKITAIKVNRTVT